MSESGGSSNQLEGLLGMFEQRVDSVAAAAEEAQALRLQAAELERTAPQQLNETIASSTRELIRLSQLTDDRPEDRVLLDAAMRISQRKPSNVIWSGPPDRDRILSNFDQLVPGTPVVQVTSLSTPKASYNVAPKLVGVVADTATPQVAVTIARGMGGLPRVDIYYALRQLVSEPEPHLTESKETVQSHSEFEKTFVGHQAIQALLDHQKFTEDRCGCGSKEHTNLATLERFRQVSEGLGIVTDEPFSSDIVEAAIEKGEAQLAYRQGVRRRQATSRSRLYQALRPR